MSGNIFASSTVPGIQDRDRDKQAIALYKQPYYLSRTDYSTEYWVKLMIGSTLLMLVVPIFLAHMFLAVIREPQPDSDVLLGWVYPLALRPGQGVKDLDTFRLAEIPISAVLTQALATANDTRSRGLLVHALLELQNPELTCFAGLGYGVYLKEMNRGARLEAFPDGKAPKCGVGGRYDEWGRVRGLRYAYQWVATGERRSLMGAGGGSGEDGFGRGVDVESLLMGWPALLLERAEVSDPLNPVPPGSRRNVYGEAVDRVVGGWCAEGWCDWSYESGMAGENEDMQGEQTVTREWETAEAQKIIQGRSERDVRPLGRSSTSPVESTFVLPSFLALYAVARQDRKWLVGAVEQIWPHIDRLAERDYEEEYKYRMTTTAESLPIGNTPNTQHGYKSQSADNAWIWAGLVRVLSVLEKWKPKLGNSTVEERVTYENWRNRTTRGLKEMANTFLVGLRDRQRGTDEVLWFCGDETNSGTCESSSRYPASTALIVSSIYRLAQLSMLDDLGLLEWADGLYNVVARQIGKEGEMSVPENSSEADRQADHDIKWDESMVIMMWAARRDCAKAGACRICKRLSWWNRLGRR